MLKPAVRAHTASFDALRVPLTRGLRFLLSLLVIGLFSRARLVGELAPFAPACFAAGLACRWSPWAMLLGSVAGSFSAGMGASDALTAASCALTLLFWLPTRFLERRDPRKLRAFRDLFAAVAAGLGALLPGAAASGGLPYNLLTAFLGAAASSLLAPARVSALGIEPRRRRLMPDEQLSLSLFAMLSLISLRAVPRAGLPLSSFAAVLTTLVLSGAGAGMGALAGIACGTALTLGGSDPFLGSTLGLCGLLAGCVKALPRGAAALAACFGNLLTVSWGLGYTIGAIDPLPLLAAGAAYCLLPRKTLRRLRGWMNVTRARADPERLAVRMRQRAGRRLEDIGAVFGELADGYGEAAELPGEGQLIAGLREALCDGCEGYADCWRGDQPRAGRLMCRLAAQAAAGGPVTPARELPPDWLRHCRRSMEIDRRLTPGLNGFAQRRRQALKRGEARGVMARQFREAQRLMEQLSTRLRSPACLDAEYAALAAAALDRAGMPVKDVVALVDDRLEITAVLARGVWSAAAAREAAEVLGDELGMPLLPVLSKGRVAGECELRLLEAPALTAVIGEAARAGGDGPSGDSHIARLLPDGRLLAAISDGMGSGEAASAESARCVSLLRKFVCAGVDRDAALAAVNSLLVMRDGEEMFATADLCVVDLHSGRASFSKLGACGSVIVRTDGVERVAGGRLPMGILDQVEPAFREAALKPGDMVVMVSDGVADELREGQADWLASRAGELRGMAPARAAKAILEAALKRDAARTEHDDMTVLVFRVEAAGRG